MDSILFQNGGMKGNLEGGRERKGSLKTNIPAMHCGYIIRKFAHQTFCTAHNIAAGGQCCVKVHKQSTVVNVMPNDKKMNHI